MNNTIPFSTAVCAEYEMLLNECRAALEAWEDRRKEVSRPQLDGKEIGNELLRLQADFARAYTMLREHGSNCEICQLLQKRRLVETRGIFN
jgi:hypothetical protein